MRLFRRIRNWMRRVEPVQVTVTAEDMTFAMKGFDPVTVPIAEAVANTCLRCMGRRVVVEGIAYCDTCYPQVVE